MNRRMVKSSFFHCTRCLYSGCFFLVFCVAASSLVGLHDRVLVSVVTHFLESGCVILPFQRYLVKIFHIGLRVSLFVYALLILLVSEVALHVRSAVVRVRGISIIFRSFAFL